MFLGLIVRAVVCHIHHGMVGWGDHPEGNHRCSCTRRSHITTDQRLTKTSFPEAISHPPTFQLVTVHHVVMLRELLVGDRQARTELGTVPDPCYPWS